MSLVPSLLNAILRLDGEALVMHVGDKPYVVTPTGQVELATRGLGLEAVSGMVSQLLPIESLRALDEIGAVQYEFPSQTDFPDERFTVVAARGGDDVWVEIRRRHLHEDHVPAEIFVPEARAFESPADTPAHSAAPADHDFSIPHASQPWLDEVPSSSAGAFSAPESTPSAPAASVEDEAIEIEIPLEFSTPPPPMPASAPVAAAPPPEPAAPPPPAPPPEPIARPEPVFRPAAIVPPSEPVAPPEPVLRPAAVVPPFEPIVALPRAAVPPPIAEIPPVVPTPSAAPPASPRPVPSQPAVVVPLARSAVRGDAPGPIAPSSTGLDRLLRIAAARGASALYVSAQARPSVRVDGEMQALEGEPAFSAGDAESLLLELMPERDRAALRSGATTEWIYDVPDVGRVRCMTFRDHRGAGGIFRMMPVRAISAEQLGLSREIQALAGEPEGLVLVAGPRSSGKSTLVAAFVDLINRTRRDHVITIESEIKIVHEHRSSLVSQREVRGSTEEMLAVAHAALREDPDVLVFEELRTADIIRLALDAAGSGHLVIGALPAHTATAVVDRIIDAYPPDQGRRVQLALAETLRGIVAQVLLRRPGGGRVAAREVLLNTPAVSSVLAEGKTSQLVAAMEGGRKYGMVPLNDALVGLVQSGAVDARDAYRRAADRAGFLALLKRQGVDTSNIERLA